MDGSREAGVYNISLASDPKSRIILNTANNSINTLYQSLAKALGPLAAIYYKAFNYNTYLAATGFAACITLGLFFLIDFVLFQVFQVLISRSDLLLFV